MFLVSRASWEESHLDEDVFFGVDGTVVGTGTTVEVVTCTGKIVGTVHVIASPVAKVDGEVHESDNKSSSVPVNSCKAHVSCMVQLSRDQLSILPVISRATQEVTTTSPLREKWVHTVVLENFSTSNKSDWAAFGLIKR